jgi:mannosyltransferase OCH1-like enzyme
MHADIPKIIHQIWIGPNEIPPNCLVYRDGIKKLHPEYEHVLWTNDSLPDLPEKIQKQMKRYQDQKKWAFQCDILRYFLLNKFGGIYLDIDFEVYRNLSEIMTKPFNITMPPYTAGQTHWISNCAFGTVPDNPVLNDILENLKDEIYHGPIFFAAAIKTYLSLEPTNKTSDLDIFNTCLTNDFINCWPSKYIFKEYAKHHALRSWHPKKPNK